MDAVTVKGIQSVVTEIGPLQKLAFLAIFFFGALVAYWSRFVVRYPRNLLRLGAAQGISWNDVRKKFLTDSVSVFEDIYENYSRHGRSVLVPVFGPHDEVILPPSALQWLTKQPDSVLSSLHAQIDSIQLDYSLGTKFAHDAWGGILIKTDLNSALETVCNVMNEELKAAFEATFGDDVENWKDVELFPACRVIAGRATLRFTLGDSPEGRRLCADEDFLKTCFAVLDAMLDTAGGMAQTRKMWRPFLGWWVSRAMPARLRELKKGFEPLYHERMDMIKKQAAGEDVTVPRDLMQMMLTYGVKERPEEAYNLDDMTKRLAVSNFGTMHQTVITLHNLFLNILDSDKHFNTIQVLRDEVSKVLGEGGDTVSKQWTRTKVSSMTRADSVARETLRLNTFVGRTVQRLVIAPEGVVTEDGVRLPKGTMVSLLAHQSQTDATNYKDPQQYDPFRFSREREAAADPATGRPGLSQMSFVSTSADFLPWSHGRHACPGRFLVDFEMKMIMAYAVSNYDIEFPESYNGRRPPISWFVGFGVPPLDAKLKVRRKKNA